MTVSGQREAGLHKFTIFHSKQPSSTKTPLVLAFENIRRGMDMLIVVILKEHIKSEIINQIKVLASFSRTTQYLKAKIMSF